MSDSCGLESLKPGKSRVTGVDQPKSASSSVARHQSPDPPLGPAASTRECSVQRERQRITYESHEEAPNSFDFPQTKPPNLACANHDSEEGQPDSDRPKDGNEPHDPNLARFGSEGPLWVQFLVWLLLCFADNPCSAREKDPPILHCPALDPPPGASTPDFRAYQPKDPEELDFDEREALTMLSNLRRQELADLCWIWILLQPMSGLVPDNLLTELYRLCSPIAESLSIIGALPRFLLVHLLFKILELMPTAWTCHFTVDRDSKIGRLVRLETFSTSRTESLSKYGNDWHRPFSLNLYPPEQRSLNLASNMLVFIKIHNRSIFLSWHWIEMFAELSSLALSYHNETSDNLASFTPIHFTVQSATGAPRHCENEAVASPAFLLSGRSERDESIHTNIQKPMITCSVCGTLLPAPIDCCSSLSHLASPFDSHQGCTPIGALDGLFCDLGSSDTLSEESAQLKRREDRESVGAPIAEEQSMDFAVEDDSPPSDQMISAVTPAVLGLLLPWLFQTTILVRLQLGWGFG